MRIRCAAFAARIWFWYRIGARNIRSIAALSIRFTRKNMASARAAIPAAPAVLAQQTDVVLRVLGRGLALLAVVAEKSRRPVCPSARAFRGLRIGVHAGDEYRKRVAIRAEF